jgi:YhcH/YjgK/YiaL family protein
MITGKLTDCSIQLNYLEDKRITRILKLIESLSFNRLPDNLFEVEGRNLYYILSSYETTSDLKLKLPEAHKKYIDFQYIIYGKEQIGLSDYSNIKKISAEYDNEKDIELFEKVENESFFTLNQNYYAIFFPEDIHRPGICINRPENVRKVIFKLLIDKSKI